MWYAKYRLPDGRQLQRKIGPAWTGRGRPAAGDVTKRLAEDWLRGVLDEAFRRVQEWMGHADVQTTMRYLHYAPRREDAALVAKAFRRADPVTDSSREPA